MKKIITNILKWLLLVFISFQFLFLVIFAYQNGGLIEAISYRISTADKPVVFDMNSEQLEEVAKIYQELADESYKIKENSNEKFVELSQLYEKYPVGITLFLNRIGTANSISEMYIVSLITAIMAGIIISVLLFVINSIDKRKFNKTKTTTETEIKK